MIRVIKKIQPKLKYANIKSYSTNANETTIIQDIKTIGKKMWSSKCKFTETPKFDNIVKREFDFKKGYLPYYYIKIAFGCAIITFFSGLALTLYEMFLGDGSVGDSLLFGLSGTCLCTLLSLVWPVMFLYVLAKTYRKKFRKVSERDYYDD